MEPTFKKVIHNYYFDIVKLNSIPHSPCTSLLHRNALLIVGRDFEDFSEHYLQTGPDEEAEEPLEGELQEAPQSFP